MIRNRRHSILWAAASILWIVVVISLYLSFNTEYLDALDNSPYIGAGLLSLILFILLAFISNLLLGRRINGIALWISTLLCLTPLIAQYDQATTLVDLGGSEWVNLLLRYAILCVELLVMIVAAYCIGDRVLSFLLPLTESVFKAYWSIALGFSILTLGAFILAALSILNQWSAAVLVILAVGQNVMEGLSFLRRILWNPISTKLSAKSLLVRSTMLGVIIITAAINLVYNIKAFPIGWDALSYYLNITQQIVESGALPQGYQAYNASLLASLASILFTNTASSMGLLVGGGILSALLIYTWVRKYAGTSLALLAAVWFYTLPNIVYLSTKDIKIDLFLLFVLLSCLSFFIHTIKYHSKNRNAWIIIGLLCAYAMGIKYTSLFFVFAILSTYVYSIRGYKETIILLLATSGLLMLTNISSISGVGSNYPGSRALGGVLFISGILYFLFKGIKENKLSEIIRYPIVLSLTILIAFSPWMIKNGAEQGRAIGFRVLFGKGEEPRLDMDKINQSPSEPESVFMQFIETEEDTNIKGNTSKREEIQRYLGYERGALKFITLPVDLAFNFNLKAPFVHIGYVFLLLLPILLTINKKEKEKVFNKITIPIFLMMISLAGLSIISYMALKMGQPDVSILELIEQFNSQSEESSLVITLLAYCGIPIAYLFMIPGIGSGAFAYPIGLICITLAGLLIQKKTAHWSREHQLLLWSSFAFSVMWWLFAGGIIWYGYLMVATMIIVLTSSLQKVFSAHKGVGYAIYASMGLWIALAVIMRLAALDPSSESSSKNLWVSPMINYASGVWDKEETLARLSPVIATTLPTINAETDSRIYRVGTFMPYFIKENNKRIYTDNQLDGFNTISQLYDTREEIARTLVRDGFKYIIVDLNTASIDKTPDASLQAKFKNFMNFLFQNEQLELMGTDRKIIVVQNGKRVQVPGLLGREYAHPGSIAVFKIKQ